MTRKRASMEASEGAAIPGALLRGLRFAPALQDEGGEGARTANAAAVEPNLRGDAQLLGVNSEGAALRALIDTVFLPARSGELLDQWPIRLS
jgi:hypothetical protein